MFLHKVMVFVQKYIYFHNLIGLSQFGIRDAGMVDCFQSFYEHLLG